MPLGIVWYRQHDDQEVSDLQRHPVRYQLRYEAVVQRAMQSPETPLNDEQRTAICQRYARSNFRQAVVKLSRFQPRDSGRLLRNALAFKRIQSACSHRQARQTTAETPHLHPAQASQATHTQSTKLRGSAATRTPATLARK